jgi:hypothetical protein
VTPLFDMIAGTYPAILLEAPEPMEIGSRTSVILAGGAAQALPNVDGTRVILMPTGGSLPAGTIDVSMTFLRDAGSGLPRLAVGGNATPETVSFDVEVTAP